MDWTLKKFMAVQMVIICTALSWPSVAYAAGLQSWAMLHEWELIVFALIVTIPFGAWLGVSIPPPKGYEAIANWSLAARWLSGLLLGGCTAIYIGEAMNPLAITVIPPSVLAAVCGASLVSLLRKRVIDRVQNHD